MHAPHGLNRSALLASLCATGLAVSGCANMPHNDVLVFATQTQVALDVSASATSAGAPSFTLGYKRNEGVWMPLVVNGQNSVMLNGPKSCDDKGHCYAIPAGALAAFQRCAEKEPVEDCLAAVIGEVKYVGVGGKDGSSRDAYSVFASFGGDFSASGGGRAAMAQFFATGIAAQKLADHPEAAKALKVEENGPLVDAQADEIASLREAVGAQIDPALKTVINSVNASVACWKTKKSEYVTEAAKQLTAPNTLLDLIQANGADSEARLTRWLNMTKDDRSKASAITAVVCPA